MNARSYLFVLMAMVLSSAMGCEPVGKVKMTDAGGAAADPSVAANSPVPTTGIPKTEVQPDSNHDSRSTDRALSSIDWESMVGKEISITGELQVVDNFNLARYGEVKVARNRLYVPTNQIDPNDADPNRTSFEGGNNVSNINKAQKVNEEAVIVLDDGLDKQNVFPPKLFPGLGKSYPTVRVGSVLNGVSGKVVKKRNKILLIPNLPLKWTPAPRPARPDVGDADVTVASFNVLNYFSTIDNGRNEARGADSKSELNRQEDKLVSALIALKADVIGVMEIENNLEAEQQLVAALNKKVGKDVFQGCGLPAGFGSAPGGKNAIRVSLIYRNDRVSPVGEVAMISDDAFDGARTPLAQTFKSKTGDEPFTVIVNHFKSKGGSKQANKANKDKGDGQGGYNAARRAQALAICKYIESQTRGTQQPRVLVIGDLNAYAQEDPIDLMRAKGLVDLEEQASSRAADSREYSYIYYGQCGALDHALATAALAKDITGIATWHINADEPRFLDYNQEYNPKSLFQTGPFRSSDHDPVIIGIGK